MTITGRLGRCVTVAMCMMATACATTKTPVQDDVPPAVGEAPYSEAFLDYVVSVRSRIEASWKKPRYAKRQSMSVLLELDLDRSGRLISFEVARPSGYEDLDASAIEAVKKGDPYPPFPEGIDRDHLKVKLEMVLTEE